MTFNLSNYAHQVLTTKFGPDPLARAAQIFSEQTAITDGVTKLNFQELNHLVNQALDTLNQILPKDVGTLKRPLIFRAIPTIDYLVLLLSCFRSGRTFIPCSAKNTATENEAICKALNAFYLDLVLWTQTTAQNNAQQKNSKSATIAAPDIDYAKPINIMLSSGSTGTPKKIVHNLKAHILSAVGAESGLELKTNDRYLLSLPLNHVGGQAIVFRALLSGATIVLPLDARASNLALKIKEMGVTVMSLVPTQLLRLINDPKAPLNTSKVRAVILGGAPITIKLVKKLQDLCPKLKLFATYGMTETAAQVCTSEISLEQDVIRAQPLPFHEVKICAGEILIKGPTIACGLLIEGHINPITDPNGFLHTGDLGELSPQGLSIKGRRDNMFISGGENICPETIEKVLLSIEGIEACVIVPIPDETWGHVACAIIKTKLSLAFIKEKLQPKLNAIYIPKIFLPWPNQLDNNLKIKRQEFIRYAQNKLTNN